MYFNETEYVTNTSGFLSSISVVYVYIIYIKKRAIRASQRFNRAGGFIRWKFSTSSLDLKNLQNHSTHSQ